MKPPHASCAATWLRGANDILGDRVTRQKRANSVGATCLSTYTLAQTRRCKLKCTPRVYSLVLLVLPASLTYPIYNPHNLSVHFGRFGIGRQRLASRLKAWGLSCGSRLGACGFVRAALQSRLNLLVRVIDARLCDSARVHPLGRGLHCRALAISHHHMRIHSYSCCGSALVKSFFHLLQAASWSWIAA